MEKKYEQLLLVIVTGERKSIHLKELGKILNVSERTTKNLIQKARENGLFILSSGKGYYFPSCVGEATSFVQYEKSRRKANRKQCHPLEAYLKKELKGADADAIFPVKFTEI